MTINSVLTNKRVKIVGIKLSDMQRARLKTFGIADESYVTVLKRTYSGAVIQSKTHCVGVCKFIAKNIFVNYE